MTTENEVVESYLRKTLPPECESAVHQGRLRAELLARVERRQAGGLVRGRWRSTALVLGLVAVAAAAAEVAVQVYRYHFEGRVGDGVYYFVAPPQGAFQGNGVMLGGKGFELDAAGIEQKRKDLEEVEALRHQNARQLVSVTETTVNGHPQWRLFTYKYQLSGGRTEITGEDDSTSGSAEEQQQFQQQLEEARLHGPKEVIKVMDTQLDGQVNRLLLCRYTLPDGRVVTREARDPDVPSPAKFLTTAQWRELLPLTWEKRGTSLGRFEAAVWGRMFTFEKYAYRLADGTAVVYAEGQPQGPKVDLTKEDWAELWKLRHAGAGEPLAEYTAEVQGRMFLFKPAKYMLSDGTEVVWAEGQPEVAR